MTIRLARRSRVVAVALSAALDTWGTTGEESETQTDGTTGTDGWTVQGGSSPVAP